MKGALETIQIVLLCLVSTFASLAYKSQGSVNGIMGDVTHYGWPLPFIYDTPNSEAGSNELSLFYDSPIFTNFFIDLVLYFLFFYISLYLVKKIVVR